LGSNSENDGPQFLESRGRLVPKSKEGPPAVGDTVMLSNIESGATFSRPSDGLTVRYVGRGEECYRIGDRHFRLSEGQVMIAPQCQGAEIEIRRSDPAGTLGLCAYLGNGKGSFLGELDAPIVIAADCTSVGGLMERNLKAMMKPSSNRLKHAVQLVEALRLEVPRLIDDLAMQSDGIKAARASTKLRAVRKVSMARSYLHSITDRAVGLDELAVAVGVSSFHLQRSFQQALKQSPAGYHRRLRLELALVEAKRRHVSLDAISSEYGFAGASGLSHAYRRTFGKSPVWSKD
jgi:AraC-like DNA-binding protein